MEIVKLKEEQPRSDELRITDIKQAMKDKTRVNIFVNGRFSFSLTISELADVKIKAGEIITKDRLAELKSLSDFGKFYQRTLEYACTRPHSEQEIRDYLRRKKMKRELDQKRYDEFVLKMASDPDYKAMVEEKRKKHRESKKQWQEKRQAKLSEGDFGPDYAENNTFEYSGGGPRLNFPTKPASKITDSDIEKVIQKLIDDHVVNDKVFAKYYVDNRCQIKGISTRRLRLELKKKGISDAVIKEVMSEDEFGKKPRDDKEEIQKIIKRKIRRGKTDPEKLISYLVRQGFPYELARDSVREMDSQNSEQNLWS